MSDFFNKKEEIQEVEPQQEIQEKIKIGENEYDQAELDRLIGLGRSAEELETKWNTKIDRLMPEYTKTTQELKTIREEKERLEALEAERNKPKEEIDWEVTRKQAREEAKKIGLVLDDDLETYYQQRKQGEEILNETRSLTAKIKEEGKPTVTDEELLQYMLDNGIKNPATAYKVMKEAELDSWKEEQLKKLKPADFHTTTTSTAGAKQPEEVIATSSNLRSLLREKFNN
jgi:hypothetical protein